MLSKTPGQDGRVTPTDPGELLRLLATGREDQLLHVHRSPARSGEPAPWPEWVPDPLRRAVEAAGVRAPWTHQAAVAELAHAGRHVIVSTGTASGKSLAYLLPTLAAVLEGTTAPDTRGATVLYLAPTKALAHDQLQAVEELALPGVRAATYDGDTPDEERAWVRAHAQVVLTNPDMIHRSLLPGHRSWSTFLRSLAYVVVDECHAYRGVFGSHVANVLRRLTRVAARYGSRPTYLLASATAGDPATTASTLVGQPVVAVPEDGSPHAAT
jgi:DEAD/DEAH box helicase domain-containing protein